MESCRVLVIYDTEKGATKKLAEEIARGAGSVRHVNADVRRATDVSLSDMLESDAYAFGTPNHYGTMSSGMKDFFRKLKPLWMQGALRGRPACVFTASGQYHGGSETALLTLMMPLFAHGMIMIGLPPFPRQFISEGCFLGAKAEISDANKHELSESSLKSAYLLGERLGRTILALKVGREAVKGEIADAQPIVKPSSPAPVGMERLKKLIADGDVEAWQCVNCGYVHRGDHPPQSCPLCNLDIEYFDAYNVDSWECITCGYVVYSSKPTNPCPVCGASEDTFMPYCG